MPPGLDKGLYRQAVVQYREWDRAAELARAQEAGLVPAVESWRRYLALTELCWTLAPPQSYQQRHQHLVSWESYYARVARLEEWRANHGRLP